MYTPYIAGTVLRTKSSTSNTHILRYHRLADGVHADHGLIKEWSKKMTKAIRENRSEGRREEHDHSPLTKEITDQMVLDFSNLTF